MRGDFVGNVVLLRVAGMDCGACERRIATVLGRLDGVGHVDADHATGEVRVRFDAGRVSGDVLAGRAAGRIEQAGFTVTGSGEPEVTS
jgi:copper chaperone CopZ